VNSSTHYLYRDLILEHFKNPQNKGKILEPDISAEGVNPLCGDEISLTIKLNNEKIEGVGIETKGCAISIASASMMGEAIKGKTLEDAMALTEKFKENMLDSKEPVWDGDLEEMECLEGVKRYPVRIKCALLGWNTLIEGIKDKKEIFEGCFH